MTERTMRAYWFPPNTPIESMYKGQMDWSEVLAALHRNRQRTTIGWLWLQRRGAKKLTLSRLEHILGGGIEVYRKPSALTKADIAPSDLLSWTAPVELNLSQMGLSRKWAQENPLWDVWVRLKPPTEPTMAQQQLADRYIADKTAADRFEAERVARAQKEAAMTQEERDMVDLHQHNLREQKRIKEAFELAERTKLVEARAAWREEQEAIRQQEPTTRAEAVRMQQERIEAGRQRVLAAATAPRKGK